MSEADFAVSTISEGGYIGAYDRLQAIQADYYNITDIESWPIAGLLVLMDGQRQPVRAELHLYEDLPDELRDSAIRQGRLLLENRYYGPSPVPLRVLKSAQWRDTVQVETLGTAPVTMEAQWFRRYSALAAAGVVLLLIALIWALTALLRGGADTAETPVVPTAVVQSGETPVEAAAPVETTSTAPLPVVAQANGAYPQTNNLPTSIHAPIDLAIGQRVRVLPGLALTLRSEPGAEAGEQLEFLKDSQEATIVNGSVWTAGETDTIVWWFVRLDNGLEAWAPANTSQLPLLEQAPQR